ncbi:MAG: GntR family transcriptional regulator [Deltaproteobacteria bacterium]|nr:GntR family transcriptional regulator [Deltaproteobacteria bacterium]
MDSVLPIYYQIKHAIRSWIINREYNPGEKIPSEAELMGQFKVSRLTVRQAISQLVQEGLLISRRGEGTFVSTDEQLINSFNAELRGFADNIFARNLNVETRSVSLTRMAAPKVIKQKLDIGEGGGDVFQIKRNRFLHGKHFSFAVNYLPLHIGERVSEDELYRKPLSRILVGELGITFAESVQTIQASFADHEVAEALAIASGSPILFIERIVYNREHKPVDVFQSSYPGDQFKLLVRFKNVKSRWVHQSEKSEAKP